MRDTSRQRVLFTAVLVLLILTAIGVKFFLPVWGNTTPFAVAVLCALFFMLGQRTDIE
jgi:hypothetical protein